jgi:hypothetical protein
MGAVAWVYIYNLLVGSKLDQLWIFTRAGFINNSSPTLLPNTTKRSMLPHLTTGPTLKPALKVDRTTWAMAVITIFMHIFIASCGIPCMHVMRCGWPYNRTKNWSTISKTLIFWSMLGIFDGPDFSSLLLKYNVDLRSLTCWAPSLWLTWPACASRDRRQRATKRYLISSCYRRKRVTNHVRLMSHSLPQILYHQIIKIYLYIFFY